MLKNFSLIGVAGAAGFFFLSSISNAAVLNTLSRSGNDCSGFYGSGFDSCNISLNGGTVDPDDGLSPVIAKWGSEDWANDNGVFIDNNDETTVNNTVFNAPDGGGFALTGSEFSIVENVDGNGDPDGTWTWTYTPGTNDPVVRYWAHKQGSGFDLYWMTASACTTMDSLECLESAVGITTGTWNADGTDGWSHITWYDSPQGGGVNPEPVPLPAAGFLLLGALGGLGALKRFRRNSS